MEFLIAVPNPEMRRFIFHEEGLRRLSALGNIRWLEEGQELCGEIGKIDIALSTWRSPRFDEAVIEQADRLKLLAHCAGTVVPYVVPGLFSSGIRVVNSNYALARSTAEFTMAHILAGVWRIKEYEAVLRNGGWSNPREKMPGGLYRTVIGIVGMGLIARLVIDLLRPFECRFLLNDGYLPDDVARKLGGEPVTLDELCQRSDVITIHHTLTEKTRGIFGTRQFSLMKDNALLVNTARGPIVDKDALLEAAQEGRIYISLDVYDQEPSSEDSIILSKYDKVTCTPHIGGHCSIWHERLFGDAVDEIERFIKGEELTREVKLEDYRRQSLY
ncbi:MAG: hydroxyacid dehydrogenase [Treponema sp.]|jgi:phosphoglycerate dehydrogenase-like enzyme|nr:hydroxyacid dehydrogenase [Treponema sp.]